MSYKLVVKDAFWQIFWRILSAIAWLLVIKMITPYLWPERYGDYSTILKYFAIWAAFADFWLYVIALKKLWKIKEESHEKLKEYYAKFVSTRFLLIFIVYTIAIIIAYIIPAYTNNPYIIWWLPLGMMFSASFMIAWIIQAPLQLFWKMKHLSIALIIARLWQLSMLFVLIYILYPEIVFDWSSTSIFVFVLIMSSVLISWILQIWYVYWVWKKYLPLKFDFDFKFSKNIIFSNRKYWFAYYLSSFHTLVVLILLSIFFPTTENFIYVWIWALALALLEILLVVPQSLWNALIHKISSKTKEEKSKSYWYMMLFTAWIWFVFMINFMIFSKEIIFFIWWNDYIWNWSIWSDYVLYFLWIVVVLSFIKQIFNYIFVSNELQNKLLKINWAGVIIWLTIWIPIIIKYNLIWWIITQILLEVLFVIWAIIVAYKNKSLPKIDIKLFAQISVVIIISYIIWSLITKNSNYEYLITFILNVTILNTAILLMSYYPIKKVMRNLS